MRGEDFFMKLMQECEIKKLKKVKRFFMRFFKIGRA